MTTAYDLQPNSKAEARVGAFMTPWQVIQQLYDSEINAGLAADWDGGVTAWIGGNPRLSERTFLLDEFDEVGALGYLA